MTRSLTQAEQRHASRLMDELEARVLRQAKLDKQADAFAEAELESLTDTEFVIRVEWGTASNDCQEITSRFTFQRNELAKGA